MIIKSPKDGINSDAFEEPWPSQNLDTLIRLSTSKNYFAHLPFAHPPDKNTSRSPLFDDPETPQKVVLARTSEFPIA